MNLLSTLTSGPSTFRGKGVNEEKQTFFGKLQIQALEGNRAALLSYSATLTDGAIVHTESTLLGVGPTGSLCLWPVMSEIPVILPHTEIPSVASTEGEIKAIFGSGPRNDSSSFREEITIQVNTNGSLVYSHAWGLPGGSFESRSSCLMLPGEA